jgi:hypothetical protein
MRQILAEPHRPSRFTGIAADHIAPAKARLSLAFVWLIFELFKHCGHRCQPSSSDRGSRISDSLSRSHRAAYFPSFWPARPIMAQASSLPPSLRSRPSSDRLLVLPAVLIACHLTKTGSIGVMPLHTHSKVSMPLAAGKRISLHRLAYRIPPTRTECPHARERARQQACPLA